MSEWVQTQMICVRVYYTYLKISIHTQHVISKSLLEASDNSTAKPALGRAHDNANIVSFTLQRLHILDRPVSGVVVDDDDLDLLSRYWRIYAAQCTEYPGDQRSNVAILLVGGDNYGVIDGVSR